MASETACSHCSAWHSRPQPRPSPRLAGARLTEITQQPSPAQCLCPGIEGGQQHPLRRPRAGRPRGALLPRCCQRSQHAKCEEHPGGPAWPGKTCLIAADRHASKLHSPRSRHGMDRLPVLRSAPCPYSVPRTSSVPEPSCQIISSSLACGTCSHPQWQPRAGWVKGSGQDGGVCGQHAAAAAIHSTVPHPSQPPGEPAQ